jgi:hypothetical protein
MAYPGLSIRLAQRQQLSRRAAPTPSRRREGVGICAATARAPGKQNASSRAKCQPKTALARRISGVGAHQRYALGSMARSPASSRLHLVTRRVRWTWTSYSSNRSISPAASGRALLVHAVTAVQRRGAKRLTILPDPDRSGLLRAQRRSANGQGAFGRGAPAACSAALRGQAKSHTCLKLGTCESKIGASPEFPGPAENIPDGSIEFPARAKLISLFGCVGNLLISSSYRLQFWIHLLRSEARKKQSSL